MQIVHLHFCFSDLLFGHWLLVCLQISTLNAFPLYSSVESFINNSNHYGFSNNYSWAVVQYDNRNLSGKIVKLLERNQIYCKLHNYTYHFFNSGLEDIPIYWRKVKLVQTLLSLKTSSENNKHHVFQGIMWLDTDAFVWDYHLYTLPQLVPENSSFTYASDPDCFDAFSPFNAGVWIVRNSQQGRIIMELWMSLYDPTRWFFSVNHNKWTSQGGIWAGQDFEQGSFAKHVLPFANELHQLPWQVLHGIPGLTDKTSFTFHFCSLPNALSAGLIQVDKTVIDLLRIKYRQSVRAQMHDTYMQFLRINFAVALLRFGIETNNKKMLLESKTVLTEQLLNNPTCELCYSNLKIVQNYLKT